MDDVLINQPNTKPLNILLVEDDDGDAKAVQRTFSKVKIANPIVRVVDGIEALEVLRGENGRVKMPTPFLILLDLNMPRMNGIQFIQEMRKDEEFHKSIVFILTTSKSEEDKTRAYELNVAGYILKETAGEDFLNLVGMIESYWKIVELPN